MLPASHSPLPFHKAANYCSACKSHQALLCLRASSSCLQNDSQTTRMTAKLLSTSSKACCEQTPPEPSSLSPTTPTSHFMLWLSAFLPIALPLTTNQHYSFLPIILFPSARQKALPLLSQPNRIRNLNSSSVMIYKKPSLRFSAGSVFKAPLAHEKILNITSQRNANQNNSEISPHTYQNGYQQKDR